MLTAMGANATDTPAAWFEIAIGQQVGLRVEKLAVEHQSGGRAGVKCAGGYHNPCVCLVAAFPGFENGPREDQMSSGSVVGADPNGTNLRVIWGGFCGLKFSSRGVVL